jgi:hypothetical protein
MLIRLGLVLNVPEDIDTSQNDSRTQSEMKNIFNDFTLRKDGKTVVFKFF